MSTFKTPWHLAGAVASATKRLVASLVARGYDKNSSFVKTMVLAKTNSILAKAQAKAQADFELYCSIHCPRKPVVSLAWLRGIIGTRKVSLVVVQRAAGHKPEGTSVQLTPSTAKAMEERSAAARARARVTAAVCKGMEIKGYIVSLSCRATRGLVAQIVEAVGNTTGLDFNTLINRGLSVFSRYERTGVVVAA
ncbi:MAG: hypothetical protein E6Q68_06765 [Polynucleobacter sp.]|nr:MAG: hypothetical protein E6Q68_06765 [Polynucleobacter sp.]